MEGGNIDYLNVRSRIVNDTIVNKALFMNVQGIIGKTFLFYNEIQKIDPDVFCFVETWHIRKQNHRLYDKYKIFEKYGTRVGNVGRFKGGMIVGIRDNVESTLLLMNDEYCIVKIEKTVFAFTYLSPALDNEIMYDMFQNIQNNTKHEETLILLGDLNARIGNFENEIQDLDDTPLDSRKSKDITVNKRGRILIDIIIDFDLKILNGTTESDREGEVTFLNSNGTSVIDLCLVSRKESEKFKNFEVLSSLESDHFPIVVTMSYPKSQEGIKNKCHKITRIKWNPEVYEQFKNSIIEHFEETETESMEDIVSLIYSTAKKCGIVKSIELNGTGQEYSPKWYGTECREIRKVCNRNIREIRNNRRIGIPSQKPVLAFLESKRALKVKMKEARYKFNIGIQEMLRNSKNPRDFYKAVALFRNKGNTQKVKCEVNLETFEEFFKNVFKKDEISQIPNSRMEQVLGKADPIPPDLEDTIYDIERDFRIFELDKAISELASNKAPGSDGIPNEVWKALPDVIRNQVLMYINAMFNTQSYPNNWSEIIICPIYKKGNPALPANYRPISLANTILKLFTKMISSRLQIWSIKNNIISEFQAAYKKRTGCRDHVFTLYTTIQYNIERGNKVYALFVDMSQAFDTVNHEWLLTKLKSYGLSEKILNTIRAIYRKASAKVRTNDGFSKSFQIEKGVLQGETMSSILFTIYLEGIVKKLEDGDAIPVKAMRALIHILLYADDIALLAYSLGQLQKKIFILNKYCTELGLRVNLSKTKYMIFSSGNDNSKGKPLWGEQEIERVDRYVYLGVTFTQSLSFVTAKESFFAKATIAAANLQSIIFRSKMNNFTSQLVLFNSLVRSTLSYCSEVWGIKYSTDFEKFRIRFLKKLFLLPKMTPEWFIRLELNIGSSEIFYIKSLLNFWARLISMNKNSLIYKCYESIQLSKGKSKKSRKQNWYQQLKGLLLKWNINSLLELEKRENITYRQVIKEIKIVLDQIEGDNISNDIENMNRSNFFSSYSKTKTHIKKESYLDADCPWKAKQLIMQLKLGVSHLTFKGKVIRTKTLQYFYGKVPENKCDLCGIDEEDAFHIMFRCPHYSNLRSKYILDQCNNRNDRTNYLQCFQDIEYNDMMNIFHYFCAALNRRKVYLEFMQSM